MPSYGFSLTRRDTRWAIAVLFSLAALAVLNAVALSTGWYDTTGNCVGSPRR